MPEETSEQVARYGMRNTSWPSTRKIFTDSNHEKNIASHHSTHPVTREYEEPNTTNGLTTFGCREPKSVRTTRSQTHSCSGGLWHQSAPPVAKSSGESANRPALATLHRRPPPTHPHLTASVDAVRVVVASLLPSRHCQLWWRCCPLWCQSYAGELICRINPCAMLEETRSRSFADFTEHVRDFTND